MERNNEDLIAEQEAAEVREWEYIRLISGEEPNHESVTFPERTDQEKLSRFRRVARLAAWKVQNNVDQLPLDFPTMEILASRGLLLNFAPD